MSGTDTIVANNLARLYREHGIIAGNQSEFARRAGIDQTFVSKILKGKTSISITYVHRMAGALGLEPWMLLVPGDWPLSNPPVLAPLSDAERRLYAKIEEATKMAVAMGKPATP